jgi:hypothetical protein
MRVSSVNGHINLPPGAVTVRADARQGWFVICFQFEGHLVEVFYNDMGREVFRVDYPVPQKMMAWERISRYLWKGKHANPDTPQEMRQPPLRYWP